MAKIPKKAIVAQQAELTRPFASTGDGRDITRPFVMDLQQPADRRLSGVDWGTYDKIRKDDQVKACLEQRIRAVVAAEWDVLPGDSEDPRSVEAAEKLKANLERIGWDRVNKKMLLAPFYGYQVAEIVWGDVDGQFGFAEIRVRHGRRFRYDKDSKLRLLTSANTKGELVPDNKFWVVTEGGSHDDELYGEGLADWLYWPTLFKRNGMRYWNIFLDKFAIPSAKATYKRGTPQKDIDKAIQILQSMALDSGFAVPETVAIEYLQLARQGTGDFKEMCSFQNSAISKIILSQTMTTDDGSSLSQATVHGGVKLDVVKADADLISDSFNEGPAKWWSEYNYGPDVAPPQVVRMVEEEADLKAMAETDAVLKGNGWERTQESFKDTYGDGYERAAAAVEDVNAEPAIREEDQDFAAPVADNDAGEPGEEKEKGRAAEFAEGEGDVIDQLVTEMMARDGWRPLSPQMQAIIAAIDAARTREDLDANLLTGLDPDDAEAMTQYLARASFAARIAAENELDR